MRPVALALSLALALVGAFGCATGQKASPPPTATVPEPSPPPAPPSTPAPPATSVPRAGGPISAPWDTAAQSRETRRAHVYPEGESAISQRLLASIPEPSNARAPLPPPASVKPAPGPPPSSSGECWEVQILTTIDKGKAEDVRDDAEKRLGVAAWVKSSDGIHRVRLGGCLTMDGAADLADRIRKNGYPEAFRVKRDL